MKGRYHTSSVRDSLTDSLDLFYSGHMVATLVSEINVAGFQTVRVHVAGDFFSERYIDEWVRIVNRCPKTTFFAYTRSWRHPSHGIDLRQGLRTMASLANFRLWLSSDRESGEPSHIDRTRVAYMAVDDSDMPQFPADLVFRVNDDTPMRFTTDGTLVCPYEQGNEKIDTTCSMCRICIRENAVPRQGMAPRSPQDVGRRFSLPVLAA